MRIIKDGKKKDSNVRFVCKSCHCEFECRPEEYWENENTVSLTYPISNECFANCPQCHKICKTYKTKRTDNISVTGVSSGKTFEAYTF